MENNITIGEIIKHYRLQKKLSQEKLAQGICDRKYISHIELGKQIPTLDIVNQLSERLGVNLYETYALMLRHHDIETHQKIELLNQYFSIEKRDQLIDLIEQYESLSEFQYGEPLLQIEYARAIYTSWTLRNYKQAIDISLKALSYKTPFSISADFSIQHYSNVELSLINVIALNFCRLGDLKNGKKYFDFLSSYMNQLFTQSHYATNRNNHFELRFFSTLVYNYFIFFKESTSDIKDRIDYALSLLKSLHSHHVLPELLLCKTYFLLLENDIEAATATYQTAHHLGLYLYEQDFQDHIEHSVLGDKLSVFNTII